MSVTSDPTIPGYVAGTWTIDPVHSEVGFSVRHMMVSKVRGKFTAFSGEIVTGESPARLERHRHHRPELDRHRQRRPRQPHPLGRLLRGRQAQDDDLPLDRRAPATATTTSSTASSPSRAITKPISLHLELGGFGPDPYGGTRAGFTATVSSTAATSASTSTPSSKPVAWSWATRWTSFSRSKRC